MKIESYNNTVFMQAMYQHAMKEAILFYDRSGAPSLIALRVEPINMNEARWV